MVGKTSRIAQWRTSQQPLFIAVLGRRSLTRKSFTVREYVMMLQELFDRWNEIQKLRGGNEGREQDWLSEELNLLEAMRLLDCRAVPGEPLDIQALISDRHRRLEAVLRKRKE